MTEKRQTTGAAPTRKWTGVKKTDRNVDNLTDAEKKRLQLILQIQALYKADVGIAEISRRTGKDVGTIKKYKEGDPHQLCMGFSKGKGKSILDPYRDSIIKMLNGKLHQEEIIRRIKKQGYAGTRTNAQIYIRKLCVECGINASKFRPGGNSRGTVRTGNKNSMDNDYITRAGIWDHVWLGIELTEAHKEEIWKSYPVLYELEQCVMEFRRIFEEKNMCQLYLFIERYQNSGRKELSAFAKGLKKDIDAVENAVASTRSNGFVEGINNRLKMIKRTMYGRCGKQLLSAKLMYKN